MKLQHWLGLALIYTVVILCNLFWTQGGISWGGIFTPDESMHRIIFELRAPRLLVILSIGGVLSAIGASYQVLFNNPLAEPYVLGISSAVTLAGAIGETVFHLAPHSLTHLVICTAAAVIASLALLGIGSLQKTQSAEKTVLFGMGMNFVFSSFLFLVLTYASQQMGGGSIRWLFGQIPWMPLHWAFLVVFFGFCSISILFLLGRHLDALSFGDSVARSLGVSPVLARNTIIFVTSACVGVLVSQTGSIGFVGLVVPHMARMLFSPRSSRSLILHSVLIGAVFLMTSDFVSRAIFPPMEFPIGIVTTILGGPFFLWLLWKK